MTTLADVDRAVKSILASKRLGQLVFARCTLQSAGKVGPPVLVARLAEVAEGWFNQPAVRVHAIGSAETGQLSVTLQFPEGGTAVLSYARTQPPAGLGGLDLMLLGNHGAIYHDAFSGAGDGPMELFPGDNIPAVVPLLDTISRALKTGKPQTVGGRAGP